MSLTVLTKVRRPGGVGELRAELEDVADLDPVAQDDGLAADRARVALLDIREVSDDVRREVTSEVDIPVVEAFAVRPGDEVRRTRNELVDHDQRVARTDRRAVAGLHPRRPDLLDLGGPDAADRLDRVAQLGLIDIMVAAHDRRDEPAVAGDEKGGLGRPVRTDAQERRK